MSGQDKRVNGGPAFPVKTLGDCGEDRGGFGHAEHGPHETLYQFGGMTLRDYFAAKAIAAHVSRIPIGGWSEGMSLELAEISYGLADAMLEARGK